MPQTYVALDLETTGLDPKRDAIIEIGCVKFCGQEMLGEWHSLVSPGRALPFKITQLTGITNRELADAPPLRELVGPLRRFVEDLPVVAHNTGFDLGFLRAAGVVFPGLALDTFELASIVIPATSSYSLGALSERFGLRLGRAHRALDDARATAQLFVTLEHLASTLPLATLIEINRLAARSQWSLRAVFVEAEKQASLVAFLHQYERQILESGDLGPLFSPAATSRPIFEEELLPVEQPSPLDVDMLAAILEPGGPMAQVFPGYEHRPPQVEMLRAVAEAFDNGDHLLIEAGTGTGKSLAYLLPAIAWAVQNRRRVVISTNTINLQEQLVAKDIPDLQKVFAALAGRPDPALPDQPAGEGEAQADTTAGDSRFRQFAQQTAVLRVALMKGRANYLCPRRLDAMRSRADLSDDDLRVLARVLVWLGQTTTGDRSELFLPSGRDQAIWSRLATESGTCTPDRCEGKQGGRCFFYRNRRQAEAAHLIIVNHALLLSDVAVGNRVLPDYRHLIIDEAHHLEDATTQQLSYQATQDGLERLLQDIYPEGGQERSGILYSIRRRAETGGLSPTARQTLERYVAQAQQMTEGCRDELRNFFTVLGDTLELRSSQPSGSRSYSQRIRLDRGWRSQPGWAAVEIAWDMAGPPLFELADALDKLRGGLAELEQSGAPKLDDLIADLSSLAGQTLEAYEQLHAAIVQPKQDGIYWIEVTAENNRLSLHSAPLHIGPLVEQHLFYPKDNVILTSATLRTADSYEYIMARLHAREARTVTVGSPFDYEASTLVYIPTDMADPNSPAFQPQVEGAVRTLARALGGRTLVLFTSHDQLRRTAESIGPELAAAGIALYQQGDGGSRRQLLENFRSSERSVLLGTRSFWEGVDVAGPALSGLVLARLPFAVPSDPVVAARAETFDDPFYQYSVPDAILRFRQGFGRLIRSQQDRGVCVILDNRVLTKNYGKLFIDSLPQCTVQRGPLALLPKAASEWLKL